MNFARVWTGFNLQNPRKNTEQSGRGKHMFNYADPMQIKPADRDIFPKPDLDGNFLGDHYPICTLLPSQPHLRKGALYRYTGKTPTFRPECESGWAATCTRLTPNATTSALYQHLCGRPSAGAPCIFPSEVALASRVGCDGVECDVDDFTVVKMVDGSRTVFYEYVRPPCVYLSFHNGGMMQRRWLFQSNFNPELLDLEYPFASNTVETEKNVCNYHLHHVHTQTL